MLEGVAATNIAGLRKRLRFESGDFSIATPSIEISSYEWSPLPKAG